MEIIGGCWGTPVMVHRLRDVLRDRRNPRMAICWLRFFLGLPDEELWSLLQRVGTQGISTDELEWLLRKYDLLDGTALFFFEPAGTSIGTDGSMHHLADGGHAQHGARELTAREA